MILVISCFVMVVFLYLIFDVMKPKEYPPGPSWLPVVGCYLEFSRLLSKFKYHYLVCENYARRYGPITGLRLGRDRIILVSGFKAVREVLTRDEFDGRPSGYFFRLRALGRRLGLVFVDGPFWSEQRKFSMKHLKEVGFAKERMADLITTEVECLVKLLKRKEGENIDCAGLFDIPVINTLWQMMAGSKFEYEDKRLAELLTLIHLSFRMLDMSGGLLNQMPFLRYFAPSTSGYNTVCHILENLWTFLREIVSDHKKNTDKFHDLVSAYIEEMRARSNKTSSFSDDQLLVLLLDLFMAGSETTSNSLSFSVLYLIRYPHVQRKIQEEIDSLNKEPTILDRYKCPYLEATIMEIMRHGNTAPIGVAHRAMKTSRLGSYVIPQDSIILVNLWSIMRDQEHWGDPDVFRPERFIHPTSGEVLYDETLIPFGLGKRRCLGEPMARTSLFIFLSSLLYHFNISIPSDEPLPAVTVLDGVTLAPAPYKACFTSRR
ncbi:hypothetical protein M8J76_015514 [Diaphorina citri]|nr:hypothetical protein M8J76_015514 [Diaphorina citri]